MILRIKDSNGKWIEIPSIIGPVGPKGDKEDWEIKTYEELFDKGVE